MRPPSIIDLVGEQSSPISHRAALPGGRRKTHRGMFVTGFTGSKGGKSRRVFALTSSGERLLPRYKSGKGTLKPTDARAGCGVETNLGVRRSLVIASSDRSTVLELPKNFGTGTGCTTVHDGNKCSYPVEVINCSGEFGKMIGAGIRK